MPEYSGAYFGKVARFNPKAFGNVEVLDLMATDCSLKGVRGGFAMAPTATACRSTGVHTSAKIARVNLDTFGNVEVLDLTATDSSLKGFRGGIDDDTYGYVVLEYNGA